MNLKHGYGLPKREEHYRVKITPCGESGGTGEVATKEYVEEKCDNVVVEVNNTINSLIVEAPKGANKNLLIMQISLFLDRQKYILIILHRILRKEKQSIN